MTGIQIHSPEYLQLAKKIKDLRQSLNTVDIYGLEPKQAALLIEEKGLKDILLEWANLSLQADKILEASDTPIFITPLNTLLLEAAQILKANNYAA